jgi:hypothetical protein
MTMAQRLTIEIKADNAAFDDYACGEELARMLREVADKIDGCSAIGVERNLPTRLHDINGNAVGSTEWKGN